MLSCTRHLALLGLLTLGVACAAPPRETARPAPQPDLEQMVAALEVLAAGSAGMETTLRSLVPDAGQEPWRVSGEAADVQLAGFTSRDGYRIERVDVRVRGGGLDDAPLLLLHLGAMPCAKLGELARRVGAVRRVTIAPSPHVLEGSTGVSGYARDYGSRRIELLAPLEAPECVTLIGVHRPGS